VDRGLVGPGEPVAKPSIGKPGQVGFGEACRENLLGGGLAIAVGGGERGELERSGDSG